MQDFVQGWVGFENCQNGMYGGFEVWMEMRENEEYYFDERNGCGCLGNDCDCYLGGSGSENNDEQFRCAHSEFHGAHLNRDRARLKHGSAHLKYGSAHCDESVGLNVQQLWVDVSDCADYVAEFPGSVGFLMS